MHAGTNIMMTMPHAKCMHVSHGHGGEVPLLAHSPAMVRLVRVYRAVPLYFCLLALATGTCYNNHDEAPFKRSRQYRQRGGSSEAPSRANLGSDLDTVL